MGYGISLKLLQKQFIVLYILHEEIEGSVGKNIFIRLQENIISLIVSAVLRENKRQSIFSCLMQVVFIHCTR
jgi:hypothetical protein